MNENDEKSKDLISAVKSYPALYDPNDSDYGHRAKQEPLWVIVAENVGISVMQAKKTWQNLRTSYRRAAAAESDETAKKPVRHQWHLKTYMDFMLPFIKKRNKSILIEEYENSDGIKYCDDFLDYFEDSEIDNSTKANSKSTLEKSKSSSTEVGKQIFPEFGFRPEEHPDLSFFYSILPDINQLSIANKRKLKTRFMNKLNDLLNEQENNVISNSSKLF